MKTLQSEVFTLTKLFLGGGGTEAPGPSFLFDLEIDRFEAVSSVRELGGGGGGWGLTVLTGVFSSSSFEDDF